jgi:hypothetical protein
MSSWHSAELIKHRDNFTFYIYAVHVRKYWDRENIGLEILKDLHVSSVLEYENGLRNAPHMHAYMYVWMEGCAPG